MQHTQQPSLSAIAHTYYRIGHADGRQGAPSACQRLAYHNVAPETWTQVYENRVAQFAYETGYIAGRNGARLTH